MSAYVSNTPSSEKSIYFDAPLPSFPEPNQVPTTSYMTEGVEQNQPADLGPVQQRALDERNNRPIIHQNGTDGWLPATALIADSANQKHTGSVLKRGSSPTSSSDRADTAQYPTRRGSAVDAHGGYVHAEPLSRSGSKRSTFTNREGRPIVGSTFINGAATTGPNAVAEHDSSLDARSASAELHLTPKQKSKIYKQEARDGRRLSKIIKQEGKAEKQAVVTATAELANLQKAQNAAIKHEAKAQAAHAKVLASFKKTEVTYLAAKTEYETALARLNAEEDALERIRIGAREATERVQEKSQEVDGLRTMLAVDAREREVKLTELKGKSGSWWR